MSSAWKLRLGIAAVVVATFIITFLATLYFVLRQPCKPSAPTNIIVWTADEGGKNFKNVSFCEKDGVLYIFENGDQTAEFRTFDYWTKY